MSRIYWSRLICMLILAVVFFQPTQSQAVPGDIITVAGTGVAGFSGDGAAASTAQLQYPEGIAVDSAGNLFIADAQNNRIRKVDGVSGTITTVAGTAAFGYSGDGGLATLARLNFPTGIAIDHSGNLYIADSGNNRIRKIDSLTGTISTIVGTGVAGFAGDGALATSAQLNGAMDVALDNAGNLYISDWKNQRIRKVDVLTGKISTVAGSGVPSFSGDGGPATAAWLNHPNGIGIDSAGNLYIADTRNGRIRKVDAVSGNISTVAGTSRFGYSGDGGPATSAWLDHPEGVAVDGSGNLYIADNLNNRIRKVDALTGNISTVAGSGVLGYSGDGGPATLAQLSQPFRVVIDNSGNFYIADFSNHSIRKVSATTVPANQPPVPTAPAITTAYATAGGSQVAANDPNAGDTHTYAVTTAAVHGTATINTGGLTAYTPNTGFSGTDSFVVTVTDASGATGTVTIFVTVATFIDTVSPVVTPPANIIIEATSASGTPATNAMIAAFLNGASATDNIAVAGSITNNAPATLPVGLTTITFAARDAAGNAGTATATITVNTYVPPDTTRPIIRLIGSTTVLVVQGRTYIDAGSTAFDNVDGNITGHIRVNNSVNTSVTGTYTVTYNVRDAAGNAARQVTRTVNVVIASVMTIVNVSGYRGYSGDGGAAISAKLNYPLDVAVDAAGNIYIADFRNFRVRKVDAATNTITTIAGTGTRGYSGDGGPATFAQIGLSTGVTVDNAGNIFVSLGSDVRKIDATTGIITTVAGIDRFGGYSGDGGLAVSASLIATDTAIDSAGNLYIADGWSHRIRKVSVSTGRISTIAGTGVAGFSGDGGSAAAAQLNSPSAVAVDHAGNLYIADKGNHRIRKIDAVTGNISTIAGIGIGGYSGDGGAANAAQLNAPEDIALDSSGNLYVADTGNNRIRKVDAITGNISLFSARVGRPVAIAVDHLDSLFVIGKLSHRIFKVSVTASGVNQSPVPTAPTINAYSGFSQVAANDPNAGDTFVYAVTTAAVHGRSTINAGGLARFTPNAGFFGTDSFVVTVTDRAGATGTVTVFIDTLIPVVTPPANITIAAAFVSGTPATNAVIAAFLNGASATDNVGVVGAIINSAPALLPIRVNTILFTVRDAAGNVGRATATITVNAYVPPDTTRPIIRLIGSATVRVVQGRTYIDAGSTALDNVDGNITGRIRVNNSVNTSVTGVYTVTYNVSDTAGNTALQVTRTVNVVIYSVMTIVNVSGSPGYSGDGGAASSAKLYDPSDVAVDAAGNIYIADSGNFRIRKIDAATNTITTIAGTGTRGWSGDGGAALLAQLGLSTGLALDNVGNIFVSSRSDVRKIDATTGIITTVAGIAGSGGYSGDGGLAVSARLVAVGVAIDNAGNLYIADDWSHRIRKVSLSTGRISTIAGTGVAGFFGDGGSAAAAQLNSPSAVAIDHAGNLYIADKGNHRIRKIDAVSGNISTVAGIGIGGYSGDGGAANAALLNVPEDIALDRSGNLYIADSGNNRIRKIDAGTGNISTYFALIHPVAVAIDHLDNLYIGTQFGHRIFKVSVTASGVNQPPVPTAPAISTAYATAGTRQVAANDPNEDDRFNYAVTTAAVHGAAIINTSGLTTYAPNAGFSGADSFVVTVTDAAGATGTVTVLVTVAAFIDTISPVLTPPANITIAAASVSGTPATNAVVAAFLNGASATDNIAVAGLITNNAPATLPVGLTTITFTARDAAGNAGTATATITVNTYVPPDTTRPIITLIGSATVRVVQGRTYIDAGSTAFDNVDGNITGSIRVNNSVNTSVTGAYTVTYNVSDAAGNTALQVTRTVNVVADTPPVISLTGATPLTIVQGTLYNDRGATAFDDVDGDVTARILTANTVNAAVVGVYTVTYNVSDAAGHAATQVTRTIHVIPAGGAANPGETIQLPLPGSVSVDVSSAGEVLSNFSAVAASGTPPAGVATPFGVLSYTTTVAAGSSTQTVNLAFSSALPTGFQLYKVDNTGAYTLIPEGPGSDHWIQLDALTIALTLTDGGRFDLDGGLVDGRIIDPVAVAVPLASTAASGGGGCVMIPSAIFDPVFLLLVLLSLVTLARRHRK